MDCFAISSEESGIKSKHSSPLDMQTSSKNISQESSGVLCNGRVSFTDFAEITSLAKQKSSSTDNSRCSRSDISKRYLMRPSLSEGFVRHQDLNPTLKPYGTNHRVDKIIALVNKKQVEKSKSLSGDRSKNLQKKKLFTSRHEISALCRHLEKLKQIDPLYSVAIYKLKAMMARDLPARELSNAHQNGFNGNDPSFSSSDVYFSGCPNQIRSSLADSQGQNSYSIIEIELDNPVSSDSAAGISRNRNLGNKKLPAIDSFESKGKSCDSKAKPASAGEKQGEVDGEFKEKQSSVTSQVFPTKSAKKLLTQPVCIRDFYLFSKAKTKASKSKLDSRSSLNLGDAIGNSRSAEFSSINISDLFSSFHQDQRGPHDCAFQSMVNMENVTDYLRNCGSKDSKRVRGRAPEASTETRWNAQLRQDIPVEVYKDTLPSSGHCDSEKAAVLKLGATLKASRRPEKLQQPASRSTENVQIKNAVYNGPECKTLTSEKTPSPFYLYKVPGNHSSHCIDSKQSEKLLATVDQEDSLDSTVGKLAEIEHRNTNSIETPKNGHNLSPTAHRLSILFHRQKSQALRKRLSMRKQTQSLEAIEDERVETAAEKYERKNFSPNSLPQISERDKSNGKWRPRMSIESKKEKVDKSYDDYLDPIAGAPPLYLHRVQELIESVADSVKLERQRPSRRVKTRPNLTSVAKEPKTG